MTVYDRIFIVLLTFALALLAKLLVLGIFRYVLNQIRCKFHMLRDNPICILKPIIPNCLMNMGGSEFLEETKLSEKQEK